MGFTVTTRPPDLPDFASPPVVEVVIGVQFEPMKAFRQAHVGLFWNEVRAEYPIVSDQPRLETPIETPGAMHVGPTFKLELADTPPTHRAWFATLDESLLLQVQDDRLIHNWRHRGGGYPRFEPLLDRFWDHFTRFEGILQAVGLSPRPLQQAEVTYVNWIQADSMVEFFRPSTAARLDVRGVGPQPVAELWSARYPVARDDRLIGSLGVETNAAVRIEKGAVSNGFQLALTFRAPLVAEVSNDDVSNLLLVGRDAIVRSFTSLTTDEMHERWGRRS